MPASNTDTYCLYNVQGSGGMFLMAVWAKVLGLQMDVSISSNGNCHNMGGKPWEMPTNEVMVVGNHSETCYNGYERKIRIIYSHDHILSEIRRDYDNIKIILTEIHPCEYEAISRMMVTKACNDLWSEDMYNRIKGADYPLYSHDNVVHSKIIQDDLIGFTQSSTKKWHAECDTDADHIIQFKTIYGLNDICLADQISDIMGLTVSDEVRQFIKAYQSINQKLYFNGDQNV